MSSELLKSNNTASDLESESEVLIKVENLGKVFCRDLKKSLFYGLKDSVRDLVGRRQVAASPPSERSLRKGEFWANKGISFELRRGECLGLIGHNGAGKTTLLKMLNGLIKPDVGFIEMRGRVSALIALGAGFNPILTGRENIYINGSVLGLSNDEINSKIEDIIDFAEIREFIDAPVQTYSSGMQVRLGFAVASTMEPDILIIDEVLAVGDLGFRVKCLNRIHELLKTTAVIFVSHSMPCVSRVSTCAMLLKNGHIQSQSDTVSEVVDRYHAEFNTGERSLVGSGEVEILAIEIIGGGEEALPLVSFGEQLKIKIRLCITSSCSVIGMRFLVWNQDQRAVMDILQHDGTDFCWANDRQDVTFTCTLSDMQLAPGKHAISVHIFDKEKKRVLCRIDNATTFTMGHHLSTGADTFSLATWQTNID
jgi:lipopolysaccharide transport system ATP-binding protein